MRQHWRIAIAGEGGQGVQLIGEVLAEAAFAAGKEALYIPNFGVEQRGGVSIAMVQIAEQPIDAPKFAKADVLVPLSRRALERTKGYLQPETLCIYESSAMQPPQVDDQAMGIQAWETVAPEAFSLMVGTPAAGSTLRSEAVDLPLHRIIGIPAAAIAQKELKPRVFNVIVLGAIVAASQVLPLSAVRSALLAKLASKLERDPELKELNLRALERGQQYVEQQRQEGGR